MEPKVRFVCIKLDFATNFIDFCEAKISEYDGFRLGTKNIPMSFVFSLQKSSFPIGLAFFCISTHKMYRQFFCRIMAGITALLRKLEVANFISQQNFYRNGASVVFSRLVAVSLEWVIGKNNGEFPKKFNRGGLLSQIISNLINFESDITSAVAALIFLVQIYFCQLHSFKIPQLWSTEFWFFSQYFDQKISCFPNNPNIHYNSNKFGFLVQLK